MGGGPDADAVGEGPTRRAAADRGSPDGGDAAGPNPSGVRADGRAEAVRLSRAGVGISRSAAPSQSNGWAYQPSQIQPSHGF